MTVERTEVRIEVTGQAQAKAAADSLQREMTDLEQKARNAQEAKDRAERGLNSWLQRLKDRGVIKRGGVELGALEMTAGGIGLNRSYFRGAGGAGGLAFAAVAGTGIMVRGASGIANSAVDAYQLWQQGGWSAVTASAKQWFGQKVAGTVGLDVAAKAAWRVAGAFQGIARSGEDAEKTFTEVMQNAWGSGLTDLDRELDAQKARMRELKARLAGQEAEDARLAEERRLRREERMAASDAEIERNSRGLKAVLPTVGLNRRLAAQYKGLEQAGQAVVAELRKARSRKLLINEGY